MKRTLYFIFASVLLLSCDGMGVSATGDPDGSGSGTESDKPHVLTLTADTYYIKADGSDGCGFTVLLDGQPLEDGFVISNVTASSELQGTSFSSSQTGEWRFMATYALPPQEGETEAEQLQTLPVTIKAVSYDVPQTVADPQPSALSFIRRILLTQFTGTECTACPGMKTVLKAFFAKEEYAFKVVLAAAHCGIFTDGDPAKLNEGLDQALGANVKPHLDINMKQDYWQLSSTTGVSVLESRVNKVFNLSQAKGGISVNSVRVDNLLRVKVSVKAAVKDRFRVGLWVLEDGIYGVQQGTNDESYYTHDACVRAVYGEVADQEDYSGFLLGDIDEGGRAEYVFEVPLEDKWVLDKCHMVVFITTPNQRGKYYVNNVVDCPLTGQTPYEYQ